MYEDVIHDGFEIILFAINNPEITSHSQLAEALLPGRTDESQIKQEIRRVIESIETDDEKWLVFVTTMKHRMWDVEEVDINIEQDPYEILSNIFKQRREMLETDPEAAEAAERMRNNRKLIAADDTASEKFQNLHQFIQQVILKDCKDKETLFMHIEICEKAVRQFKKENTTKKKRLLMQRLRSLPYICSVDELKEVGFYYNASQDEVFKLIYSDKSSKRAVEQILRTNRLSYSEVKASEYKEPIKDSKPEPATPDEEPKEEIPEEPKEEIPEEPKEEIPEEPKEEIPEEPKEEIPEEPKEEISEESKEEADEILEEMEPYFDDGTIEAKEYGGFVEWSGYIGYADDLDQFMLDTNIILTYPLLSAIANQYIYCTGWVDTVSVLELRKLAETSEDREIKKNAKKVFKLIYKEGADIRKKFLKLVSDEPPIELVDNDIQIVNRAKERGMTFVTNDSGAAAYARTIACPYRLIRKFYPGSDMSVSYVGPEKIYLLDTGVFGVNMASALLRDCSQVVITSEYARYLNSCKLNPNYVDAVRDMQLYIATDLNKFFMVHENDFPDTPETRMQYERELIEVCKRYNYTFITANIITCVWFRANGAKAECWYQK